MCDKLNLSRQDAANAIDYIFDELIYKCINVDTVARERDGVVRALLDAQKRYNSIFRRFWKV